MTLFNDLGQLSRDQLEQVASLVAAQMQLPWAASPVVHGLTGGFPLSQTPGTSFFAQITGSVSGGSNPTQYNWTEAVELGTGLFIPLPGGRTDNGLALPAYEVSDNTAVPTDGTVFVRMWQSETNGNYYFSWPAVSVSTLFSGANVYQQTTFTSVPSGVIPSGVVTTLLPTNVNYDTGSYSALSGSSPTRLTAQATGKYLLTALVDWFPPVSGTPGAGRLRTYFAKNGVALQGGGEVNTQHDTEVTIVTGQSFATHTLASTLAMTSGDYIEVDVQQQTGGTLQALVSLWTITRLDGGPAVGFSSITATGAAGATPVTGGTAGNILIDTGGTVGEDTPGTLDTSLGTAVGAVPDGTYGG